jgi:superfamily I DNA/RNA helicase
MSRLDDLNRPQREAVVTVDGPVLVLAGAGSGKTRVITYRVAHLLDRGVAPEEILAVSFTNKAANEMHERVEKIVGPQAAKRLTLCTFHALGLQICKREKAALGFPSGFTIYDAADQLGVVREALRTVQLDDRRFDPKAILFRISRAKNAFLTPDELAKKIAESDHEYDEITASIYPRYQAALRGFHALDFDDLIVETVRLLDRDEPARARWSKRYRYVMVDEYQDTNRTQLLLVRHLVALHNNLCVVGDDDQSIYAWRGAESGNILDFERHFPGAKRITLDENYRSTPLILDAANAVIAHNAKRHEKRLFTTRATGDKLQLVVAPDPEGEARFVAEEIDLLRERRGFKASDCAVLYRSNIQARAFEEALRTQRINYRMIGGQAFFDRKEVKDAIAYLKAALHPRDEISLRRIINYPARGIGETTLDRITERAHGRKMPLWEVCKHVDLVEGMTAKGREAVAGFVALLEEHRPALQTQRGVAKAARALCDAAGLANDLRAGAASPSAAQRRLDNLDGFFAALDRWEQRHFGPEAAGGTKGDDGDGAKLVTYLQLLTLATGDDDDGDWGSDQVTLVTLHGAKGLEFPVVFLVGLEEELLPHRRTLYPQGPDVADESPDLSEERRLMYVGITRARERLYLTRCRERQGRDPRARAMPRSPSRFLDEVPKALCEERDLDVPTAVDPGDEEAFARDMLARLRKMTE